MSARLLIVALDGADGRLLDRATQDGTLPNLAALRRRGRAWRLSASWADTDDSLWASFQYGVGMGEHGRSTWVLEDDFGQRRLAVHEELDREAFWDRLSARGCSVALFDVPKCRQPRPLNGIHLADWLTHGRYFPVPLSYPETLAGEVVARFGAAPPSICAYVQPGPIDDAGVEAMRRNLLRSVAQKRAAGVHFLSQRNWDLFAIGFKEAHCSAHHLWEFNDPSHAKFDAERVARLGNPVLEVLKAQDAAVGALVARAGASADIVAFSTCDFAPNGTVVHLMDAVGARINRVISGALGGEPHIYCRPVHHNENVGAFRVPRQPGDTDATHKKRIELVARLALELVDADDGLPVVSAIGFPASEQTGMRARSLPHVLLRYRINICPSAVSSPRLGRISADAPHMRTGNHSSGGFAFAAGGRAALFAEHVRTMADFAALAEEILTAQALSQSEHSLGYAGIGGQMSQT